MLLFSALSTRLALTMNRFPIHVILIHQNHEQLFSSDFMNKDFGQMSTDWGNRVILDRPSVQFEIKKKTGQPGYNEVIGS